MITFHIGTERELPDALRQALWRYRYEVFVRRLGWNIPGHQQNISGEERDQFDTQHAVHVIALGAAHDIQGCARLLRTDRPYLLGEVFASLLDGPPPQSSQIWEVSRLGCIGRSVRAGREIFAEALRTARRLGARQVIGVMSRGVEASCRRYGYPLQRLSAPQHIAGELLVASAIDLDRTFLGSTQWQTTP